MSQKRFLWLFLLLTMNAFFTNENVITTISSNFGNEQLPTDDFSHLQDDRKVSLAKQKIVDLNKVNS